MRSRVVLEWRRRAVSRSWIEHEVLALIRPRVPGDDLGSARDYHLVHSDIDLSEFDGDTDWDWERVYDEVYARPLGAPGRNRDPHGGPPIAPLHPNYRRVRDWWRQHGHGQFHPTCTGEEEAYWNADSRFLMSVIQSLERAIHAQHRASEDSQRLESVPASA